MKRDIDLNRILTQEIKGRNIYISNGFPCLYGLLESLKRSYSEYAFEYDPHLIYDLIVNSEAWEALKYEPYYYQIHRGLLNGFPGTILTLLDLKKKYL